MSGGAREVERAIERWESRGLISPDQAVLLRGEVEEASQEGSRRLSQYVLAGTGAVLVLIAAGVFMDWAWYRLGDDLRTGVLAVGGVSIQLLGARFEWRRRWVPASWFMQTAGLALVLAALAWSEAAWPDLSAEALALGVLAMVWVLASFARSIRRSAFMPAVHLVFLLAYLALFLDRSTGLGEDQILWTLDSVLLVATFLLVRLLVRDPAGEEHPWALPAFVSALYAGFVLVGFTGARPLGLGAATVLPLDLWLALVAALTLWAAHRAPPGLRRDWMGRQLAWVVLAWIPLGFFTALEWLDGPPELAVAMVGGVGVAGFLYADRTRTRPVLGASAFAFVCVAWFWGVERAGALGAVLALGVTAGVLFWLSGRWGGADRSADRDQAS